VKVWWSAGIKTPRKSPLSLPSPKGVHTAVNHTSGLKDVTYCPCSGSCNMIWYLYSPSEPH